MRKSDKKATVSEKPTPSDDKAVPKNVRPHSKADSMLDPKTGRIKPEFKKPRGPKADPESGRSKRRANEVKGDPPGPKPSLPITRKRKTKAEKADHAATQAELERYRIRNKILSLREQGATIRQITEQMQAAGEKGCSQKSVQDHLVAALTDLHENYTLNVKHYAQLRLNQCYRVELAHFKRLCDPHLSPDDFEKLSRGMDRIWKRMDEQIAEITGTGKRSTTVEISSEGGGPVEANIRVIMPPGVEPEAEA